jgi:hypothetical protein
MARGALQRSSNNRIRAFADIVYKAGYASPIRTPRGEDIMAACGQLKSATERARKSRAQVAAEAGCRRWWRGPGRPRAEALAGRPAFG